MTASTMLLLKISRTKKRLSNNIWYLPIIIIASVALMTFLSAVLRGIALPGTYGVIEAEIPVIAIAEASNPAEQLKESTRDAVSSQTTVIILTAERFYFGSLQAFGEALSEVNNKFHIPHVDGAPNLPKLITDISKWQKTINSTNPSTAIFIPTEEIPMPIVIQCMAALKSSGLYKNIVLGGGLL